MNFLRKNHFEVFSLPERFGIDPDALTAAYRAVQAAVHPDRFAAAGDTQKRVAMQMAAQVNEAFRTLGQPVARARYLCELGGVPVDAESNTAMPAEFLGEQMQWREALDEARDGSDFDAIRRLDDEIAQARDERLAAIAQAIDERQDLASAAALVRQLMFIERFADELESAKALLAD